MRAGKRPNNNVEIGGGGVSSNEKRFTTGNKGGQGERFESPSKGRQLYNKTQTIEMNETSKQTAALVARHLNDGNLTQLG